MTVLGELHKPDMFNKFTTEELSEYYVSYTHESGETFCKDHEDLVKQEYALPDIMAEYIEHKVDIGSSIAEIGIGSGLLAKAAYGDGGTSPWDGYDICQSACDYSNSLYKSATQHNINDAPLPKKYDVILACNLFSDGLLDATCLDHIRESLNEDGVIIASFPRGGNYWVRSGWYYDTYFELQGSREMVETGKYFIDGGRRLGHHDIKLLRLITIN